MLSHRTTTPADEHRHVVTQPGISLAKGPAILIGLGLCVAGLLGLLHNATFTALSDFPNGDPTGTTLGGIEINGWTSWLTIAAGVLVLFGAAAHLSAKVMSLVVGIALVAAAVIGFLQGDVLGLAASNWLTELIWAAVGVALVANTFSPRRTRSRELRFRDTTPAPPTAADEPSRPHAAPVPLTSTRRSADDDRSALREAHDADRIRHEDEAHRTAVREQNDADSPTTPEEDDVRHSAIRGEHDEDRAPIRDQNDDARAALREQREDGAASESVPPPPGQERRGE